MNERRVLVNTDSKREFARSHVGAPKVSNPENPAKSVTYSRASGYMVEPSTYNLMRWKERQLTAGLALMYDLDINPDLNPDPFYLNQIINDAYNLSGTDQPARRGTHIHSLCERAVNGESYIDLIDVGELPELGIPSSLQESIVKSFVIMRQRLGVRMLAAELQIVNDTVKAAGTADLLDILDLDIQTDFGDIVAGQAVIADIKTGDGKTTYWTKYGPQLVIYRDGAPYNVDTDERLKWEVVPHADIALIYHYDLKRALAGEVVEWQVIPVSLEAAREGVSASQAIKQYAKRKDVFGAPVGLPQDRRTALRERYALLNAAGQELFGMLGIDPTDLDAVEVALDSVDPFAQVLPLHEYHADHAEPPPRPVPPDEGAHGLPTEHIKALYEAIPDKSAVNTLVQDAKRAGVSFNVKENPTERRCAIMGALCALGTTGNLNNEIVGALLSGIGIGESDEPYGVQLGRLHAPQAVLFAQRANATANPVSNSATPALFE